MDVVGRKGGKSIDSNATKMRIGYNAFKNISLKKDASSDQPSAKRKEIEGQESEVCVKQEPEKRGVMGCLCRNVALHKGLIFALLSCFFLSSSAIAVKMLAGRVHPTEVATFRLLFYILPSAPLLIFFRVPFKLSWMQLKWMLLRVVCGSTAMCLSFYAYQNISVGDASALLLCNTIFTGILAWLIMGEKYTIADAALAVIAVGGVTLIARPSFIFRSLVQTAPPDGNMGLGVTTALICALCVSLTFVLMRKLGGINVHPLVHILVFGMVGSILTSTVTTILGVWTVPHCGRDRLLLIFAGIMGFLSQTCMVLAFKMEKASYVAMVKSNNVIVAFLLEFAIFGQTPHWLSMVGTLMVLFSSLALTFKKWRAVSKKQDRGPSTDEDEGLEVEERGSLVETDEQEDAHKH